jgi:hypothetical protein
MIEQEYRDENHFRGMGAQGHMLTSLHDGSNNNIVQSITSWARILSNVGTITIIL